MREKSLSTVRRDLASSGIKNEVISTLVRAIGLTGNRAKQFIIDNDLLDYQITIESQKKLFKVSYDYEASEVKRICSKTDVKETYGITDWGKLNSVIKEVAIDLKFRGDYSPKVRRFLQKAIVKNDLNEFYKIMSNKGLWLNVPSDRFNRRVKFIEKNI
ncbi:hypothetical protein ACQKP8_26655 [Photobacterium alginatilyticum]|uniref:hypothetical protein n=1 Tax=Photobacterium alginatilyticum TaxID=1775171 RepID=UPI004067F71C